MKVVYRNLDGVHVFSSRDVRGVFVTNADLATAYAAIPGQPVIPVEAFIAWVQNGPGVVLAANEIVFN